MAIYYYYVLPKYLIRRNKSILHFFYHLTNFYLLALIDKRIPMDIDKRIAMHIDKSLEDSNTQYLERRDVDQSN